MSTTAAAGITRLRCFRQAAALPHTAGHRVVSLPYHPPDGRRPCGHADHITRGRVMFGVGPGAQVLDALMMGLDPSLLRERMNEALGVVIRLFNGEVVTHHADWFTLENARLQVAPYTKPHMPIYCAAIQSPSGMVAAGQHGTGILTVSVPRGDAAASLGRLWKIAEETAEQHGNVMDRNEWRLVLHVHLADSKREAISHIQNAAVAWRKYGVATGFAPPNDTPGRSSAARRRQWRLCVGTPTTLSRRLKSCRSTPVVSAASWCWAWTGLTRRICTAAMSCCALRHAAPSRAISPAWTRHWPTPRSSPPACVTYVRPSSKAEADYANAKEPSPTAAS